MIRQFVLLFLLLSFPVTTMDQNWFELESISNKNTPIPPNLNIESSQNDSSSHTLKDQIMHIPLKNLSPNTVHKILRQAKLDKSQVIITQQTQKSLLETSEQKQFIEWLKTKRMPLRILSLDGGGTRGILALIILAAIEKKAQKPIYELFDVIIGSSTGALIVGGTQMKLSALELIEIHHELGKKIFSEIYSVGGLFGPKYSSRPYEKILNDLMKDTPLGNCEQECLFPTYNHTQFKQQIFSSRSEETKDVLLRKVVLASSSAQTYFPPVEIQKETFMDGGLTSFNPANEVLNYVCSKYKISEEECILVSIGTGFHSTSLTIKQATTKGAVGWLKPLLNIMLNGETTHQSVKMRMESKVKNPAYFRFQIELPSELYKTDSITNFSKLQELALKELPSMDRELNETVALITDPMTLFDRLIYY